MIALRYRAEIDGLRALAVVPVILFHAGFELFSGGFVGVDVFFVISGYLITTILVEDVARKRFSIINFYERRMRRILPALFFVMLVCIPFAWMWMVPSQTKDFSASIFSVSVFLSNLYFMSQVNYFAPSAELNPLLHTWSLSIEEQFYLFFPPLLLLLLKPSRRFALIGIFLIAALSFTFSELAWRENQERNFFFSFSRFWELFAGSIAAFIVQKYGVQKNNCIALLGLVAIIFSIFVYDESTPFPSIYALVPVMGVVLIVLYAEKQTLAARILGTKAFVGIGLISYSAYLWHQPLFAFARFKLLEEPSPVLMAVLSLTSLVFAYFSWNFIEKPFRNRKLLSGKIIFTSSFIGLVFFMAIGILGYKEKISPNFSDEQTILLESFAEISSARHNAYYDDICHYSGLTGLSPEQFLSNWNCYFEYDVNPDLPHFAVAGDSNAADLANGFRLNEISVASMSGSGCSLVPKMMSSNCKAMFSEFIKYVNSKDDIEVLVLTNLFTQNEYSNTSIIEMVQFWKNFSGQIVFLHDTPRFPNHYNALLRGIKPVINLHYDNLRIPSDILTYLEDSAVHTKSRNSLFCEINSCNYFSVGGDALISDERGEHLSLEGAKAIIELLVNALPSSLLRR